MRTGTAAATRLADVVGAEHLILEPESLARYAVDGVTPAVAVRPGTAREVTEVVRLARSEKLATIPLGARKLTGIGMPPARFDLALDLTRLGRVLAYDPGDLTLSVEVGLRIARLNETLAEKNQFLPLLTPFHSEVTIGGILATNLSGPQRHAYGTARDFVLGLEFVTGAGECAKSGGRVVKNVTGYDLHKLLIGSLGTLAVITVANFRTFPLPPAQTTLVAVFAERSRALGLQEAIQRSPLAPHALEILSPAMAGLLDPDQRFLSARHWSLLAAAAGNQRVVERHASDLQQMAEHARADSFRRLTREEEKTAWTSVREYPAVAAQASPAATIVKMNTPPTRFGERLAQAMRIAEAHELPWAALVRAAGIIYFLLLPGRKDEATLRSLEEAARELMRVAVNGGSVVLEWCPAELKRGTNVWGSARGDLRLMRKLKAAFDPDNVLSPGRYLGGI